MRSSGTRTQQRDAGWTLDLAPLREFAGPYVNREERLPGTPVWRLAESVLALCAEVETMREIHAYHVSEITRLQSERAGS